VLKFDLHVQCYSEKTCNLSISLKVPEHFRVTVQRICLL